MTARLIFATVACVIAGWLVPGYGGVGDLRGTPPYSTFSPDIEVYPQHFDLAQTADGLVLVANVEGILSFDGARWELLELPDGGLVRSLAHDGQGRVYVGGVNQFGYVEPGLAGSLEYRDLATSVQDQSEGTRFEDIWNLLVTPEGVFFQAVQHLFRHDPETGETAAWFHEGRFGAMVHHQGETLVQFRGEGLKRYRNGSFSLVPGGEALTEQLFDLVPLPDGGLLTVASDGRWSRFGEGEVNPYSMPDAFPDSSRISATLVLPDDTLVLGSSDGHIHFFDSHEHQASHFRISRGRITGLIRSVEGRVLLVADNDLIHLNWPSAWSIIGPDSGLTGRVLNLARWDGRWLALTDAGVAEAVSEASATTRFRTHEWSPFETWDWLSLDDDTALLADSYRVHLIADGSAEPVTGRDFYPVRFRPSEFDPDIVYVGTSLGLGVLRHEAGQWHELAHFDDLHARVFFIQETGPRALWLASLNAGLIRVGLADDYSAITETIPIGPGHGLDYGGEDLAAISTLGDGQMYVSTAGGFYRFDGEAFVRDDLDGLEELREPDDWLILEQGGDGVQWAYGSFRTYRREPGQPWREEDISPLLPGALYSAKFSDDGVARFGANGGILQFDPAVRTADAGEIPGIRWHSVVLRGPDGSETYLALEPEQPHVFEVGTFALRFRYAVPDLVRNDAVRYQEQLVGFEPEAAEWKTTNSVTYSQLDPGTYRFQARGRDSRGQISELPPFEFTVIPPWHATRWAQVLRVVLALMVIVAGVAAVARWRISRLADEKQRLESLVSERTRELASANRRLDTMAHLDGLTGIANRRRLDSYLPEVSRRCHELKKPLAILIVDVDHFKEYNDLHGHIEGDRFLKELTDLLERSLRRTEDLVARYGGEEFILVLPGAGIDLATSFAEDLRLTVVDADVGATISIGVASFVPKDPDGFNAIIKAADQALYQAKSAGRNCVVAA